MRRVTIWLGAFLCFAGLAAGAQQLLPNSFGGWSGTVQSALPLALANRGNRQANATPELAVLAEYGFVAGESGAYQKGPSSLQVDLYRMKDPTGAYGLLTYLRTPEMKRFSSSRHSFASDNEALLLAGNLLVDVRGKNLPRDENSLKELLRQVGTHAEGGALPTLWQQLPAQRMIAGSDKYVLGARTLDQLFPVPIGEAVGFDTGAEAELARYHSGRSEATILLVDLPTPQIATEILGRLSGQFDVNNSKPGQRSPLYAKRLMTTIVMVAGAATDAEGKALLNEVQNAAVLTWDEPAPKGKQADIYTIVIGTIIGTGAICVFSIIAGLAFGGFRLAVKRALPGKIFDREKDIQVLQLGLSSKPVSTADFYDRSGPRVKLGHADKNLPDKVALRIFR